MSEDKREVPEWLSSRLFAVSATIICVFAFPLFFITGILQVITTFFIFIIESIDRQMLRWRDIEIEYLRRSFEFIWGMIVFPFMIIFGRKITQKVVGRIWEIGGGI